MVFKFVPYAPEGSGGKDPVLAELVVTENGVYDEPMIGGGPEPITWDGVVGDKVTVDAGGGALLVKVSDRILSVAECVDCTIGMSTGESITVGAESMGEDDGVVQIGYWVFSATNVGMFPETGTYFLKGDQGTTTSLTFAGDPPTPADGWNKVTVNVAGDIIDVPELPTENVDETKIYRVRSEVQEMTTEIWHVLDPDQASMMGVPVSGEVGELWRIQAEAAGMSSNFVVHVVDELPEVGEPGMIVDNAAGTVTINIYVLKDKPESPAYNWAVNDGVGAWHEYSESGPYRGTMAITDVSELENLSAGGVGYYVVNRSVSVMRTVYAIPNANPVKRLVDGVWTDLT